jgi:hypothetical protein
MDAAAREHHRFGGITTTHRQARALLDDPGLTAFEDQRAFPLCNDARDKLFGVEAYEDRGVFAFGAASVCRSPGCGAECVRGGTATAGCADARPAGVHVGRSWASRRDVPALTDEQGATQPRPSGHRRQECRDSPRR